MKYDIVATVDYSGARSNSVQKKHIYLTMKQVKNYHLEIVSDITRDELLEHIQSLLRNAHKHNKFCIIGFDFSFWFPFRFFQLIYKKNIHSWREQLKLLNNGIENIPPLGDNPRKWAEQINEIFYLKYQVNGGPFWGPGFLQGKKPQLAYQELRIHSRRLVEERIRRMKSIFQIGGIGSVGLQALYGIGQMKKLLSFCRKKNIPVHVWPFDGWEPDPSKHLICEIYPALYNKGPKRDLEDALASAHWFAKHITSDSLVSELDPGLTSAERRRAKMEGWVPGVH